MERSPEAAESLESFDVVVLGFEPTTEPPQAGLQRMFGIDLAAASKLIESAPATVQRGVNRVRAEYFRRALVRIGARVEVRNENGGIEREPEREPEKPAAAAASAHAVSVDLAPRTVLAVPALAGAARASGQRAHVHDERAVAATERPVPPAFGAAVPVVAGAPKMPLEFLPPPAAPTATAGATPQAPSFPGIYEPAVRGTQFEARAPVRSAPSSQHANDTAMALRAPAHRTLKEAVPAPETTPPDTAANTNTNATHFEASTAQAQRAPLHAFRLGDTNAPFLPNTAKPAEAAPPFVLPIPAPVPARPPASPLPPPGAGTAYGGIPWGDIDRGRYSTGPHPQHAPLGKPPSSLEAPPTITLDRVVQAAAPAADASAATVDVPPPAPTAADASVGNKPDISARILPNEAMPAPSLDAMTAALRKQAIKDGQSGLGAARDVAIKLPAHGRGPRPAANSAPADAAVANAVDSAATTRALLSARHGRAAMPGQAPLPAVAQPASAAKPPQPRAAAARSPNDLPTVRETMRETTRSASNDARSFWETIPEAMVFPMLGDGTTWIVSITACAVALSLLCSLLVALPVPGLGALASFVMLTVLLAFCADFHRRCVASVTTGKRAIDQGPDFDPGYVLRSYLVSGVHLSLFVLASQLPLSFWIIRQLSSTSEPSSFQLLLSPTFWGLAVGPGFYWPMAMAIASLHGDYAAVWYVPLGLQGIVRAPLEHMAIAVLGVVTLLGLWAPFLWIGLASGLPTAFFFATLGLPMAVSAGVMGALSGHLARTHPDAFG